MKLLSNRIRIQKKGNQKSETEEILSYYSRKTTKVIKVLLVNCAPATIGGIVMAHNNRCFFIYRPSLSIVDQWFRNISNKRETKEKKIKSLVAVVNDYRVQKVTQSY